MKQQCPECDGSGGRWGLAPHSHSFANGRIVLGGTRFLSKDKWPANFTETEPGEGIYTCTTCNGEGTVDPCNHQWKYFNDDERRCLLCPSHQKWSASENDWSEK